MIRAILIFAFMISVGPLGFIVLANALIKMWREEPFLFLFGLFAGIALYFPLRALERWANGQRPNQGAG